MDIKERMDKFDAFLTKFAKASGASELCESVREAAKVCFEGIGDQPAWADPSLIDPKYKNNTVASFGDIHRKVFHDIPLAKLKERMRQKAAQGAPADVASDTRKGHALNEGCYYVYRDDPNGRYGHFDEETVRRKVNAGDAQWRDFMAVSNEEKKRNDFDNDCRRDFNTRETVADQNAEAAGRDARRHW